MDSWERFNETALPNKKAFYSKLYLEVNTGEDYIHAQKVFEEFKLKDLGEYHDLYIERNTLFFVDVFENFLSAPGLAWQAWLKKYRNQIRIINR